MLYMQSTVDGAVHQKFHLKQEEWHIFIVVLGFNVGCSHFILISIA